MGLYERVGKRVLDVLVSSGALLLALPVLIIIVLLYIVTFSFPVFYRQERIGRKRAIFRLLKFRSLTNAAAPLQERRFPLGDLLRFTSLDELPQLFQVLTGTMSCVGPRPLPVEYLPLFSERQQQRHNVRPGITGWAQVNGRNSISWPVKLEMDLYYVQRVSLWLDLKILFKTALILFSFKKDVSLKEEKFTGNN